MIININRLKAILIMLALMTPSLLYGVMLGLSTEALVRESSLVVTGEVEQIKSEWSRDGKTIVTIVTIAVADVIRGAAGGQRITVEYEGGEIGDIGLRVSDVSSLVKGETVLLFLKSGESRINGQVHNIAGKAQGKYVIDGKRMARKSGFSVANGAENIDYTISLDKLIEKIRNVK